MEWLNYHHLLYFWTVARTGSIAAASEELRLAAPTISNQIHKLEGNLGEKLFRRTGRRLALTEMGRVAMRYADEIFSLGREFTDTMKDRPTGRPLRLCVGIADVLPKLIAYKILEPAFRLRTPIRIICREDRPDHLLADLAVHDLDVVLSDSPASPAANIRAFSHLLGECGVSFFASKNVKQERPRFPKCVDGARFLVPTDNTAFRRSLDEWFVTRNIRPVVVGEFADFALLRVFAEEGYGIFAAPSVVEAQLRSYGFKRIGRTDEIRVRFYAISVERKLQHPAVVAICEAARQKLFS
ncbi:MAG TPA: transcriptional activator NhaR [Terriglobales bacterium]|nr:transcriptional activator NhaR [Terriglobales bacterium]